MISSILLAILITGMIGPFVYSAANTIFTRFFHHGSIHLTLHLADGDIEVQGTGREEVYNKVIKILSQRHTASSPVSGHIG